jgi:AcrR family transcriptional regulator
MPYVTILAVPTVTRAYGGVSADQRRSERRERLLEAGLELFGTSGAANTTVRGICRQAGLTERYFYESFDDSGELLLAVFDRLTEEIAQAVLEAIDSAPADAREKSRAGIGAMVGVLTDDPRKGRVAVIEGLGSEELIARRLEALRGFAQLLSDQARAFLGSKAPSRKDADLTAHALVGGTAELLIAWMSGALNVSRERLIDHCTNLFVAAADVTSG